MNYITSTYKLQPLLLMRDIRPFQSTKEAKYLWGMNLKLNISHHVLIGYDSLNHNQGFRLQNDAHTSHETPIIYLIREVDE